MVSGEKSPDAFRTIGELSAEIGVAQHILRYWESKFPQLRPLQRAGNRRYYRPADVALARRIHRLLGEEGYTVKGVQKLLRDKAGADEPLPPPKATIPQQVTADASPVSAGSTGIDVFRLIELRNRLADALAS
jgi:DNA-binding transcriptional MerR regulator